MSESDPSQGNTSKSDYLFGAALREARGSMSPEELAEALQQSGQNFTAEDIEAIEAGRMLPANAVAFVHIVLRGRDLPMEVFADELQRLDTLAAHDRLIHRLETPLLGDLPNPDSEE